MKRRLLNLLTALSLVLFLGVTVLAVRSHWIFDSVTVRWNPVPAERLSSGHVMICNSWPGALALYVRGVTDADAPFWRDELPGATGWTYPVGGDGRAMHILSGHYGDGFKAGRKWLFFRCDRAEEAPSTNRGGTAARVVHRWVVVPHWLMMLLAAALPFARLRGAIATRRRRTVRAARGQCVRCGYDLCATPERCPECGQPALRARTDGRAADHPR